MTKGVAIIGLGNDYMAVKMAANRAIIRSITRQLEITVVSATLADFSIRRSKSIIV